MVSRCRYSWSQVVCYYVLGTGCCLLTKPPTCRYCARLPWGLEITLVALEHIPKGMVRGYSYA